MAGFIEESARFLVFKTMMRDNVGRENAVSYGLGHGGLECFSVLGMTMISNLMLAVMFIPSARRSSSRSMRRGRRRRFPEAIAGINAIDPAAAALACFERACSMALQVELSILVFGAVHLNKFWLYPVSILLHMGVDFFAALYQTGTLSALWVVEVLLAAYVVALFFAARAVYKKLPPRRRRRCSTISAGSYPAEFRPHIPLLAACDKRRRRVPLNFMLLHKNRKTY